MIIYICIPEIFNTNILHQLLTTITFVNPLEQIQNVILHSKSVLKVLFKDFQYTKINQTQI